MELQSAKYTPAQLRDVFNRWYKRGAAFLRPDQTRDDYLTQFMNAYASAKVPLGEGVITQAWQSAHEKPLPPEALEAFEAEPLRRVVALCRELQVIAGKEPFYLSARTLQRLLKQEGHATAARWLRSLCVSQILEEVEKGSGNHASRYHYKGALEEGLDGRLEPSFEAARVANRIITNQDRWHYDNCKVDILSLQTSPLAAVLAPYLATLGETQIIKLWRESAEVGHASTVDGLAQDPVSYCVGVFKRKLEGTP